MRAVQLAELSGIAQSTVSRLVSGEQPWVSPEDLATISKTLTDNSSEQAELLRAHLLDECTGPAAKLIEISYSGHQLRELPVAYQVNLPDELERHMATIREYVIKDKNVREIIEGLGELLRNSEGQPLREVSSHPTSEDPEDLAGEIIARTEADLGMTKKPSRRKKKSGAPEK